MIKKNYNFKMAWAWPQRVENFFKENIVSPSCHIFCGSSKLGDVRVDLLPPPKTQATQTADILKGLPFPDDSFETVFGDPPWEMPYHLRSKIMYEIRRICRPNGRIILNANWSPHNLKGCALIEPIYISVGRMPFANTALIIRYLKLKTEKEIKELLKQ